MSEAEGIPVVELSEKEEGGYKLNVEELKNILLNEEVAGKEVAVISVAGAFRKGKSFLLNFLVHYLEFLEEGGDGDWFDQETVLDKFHWRGGSKRDTHGIIMWSRPYFIEKENGDQVVVLLMDTQGTFDHNSTVQECATIFALSTLLSSVQIFNISQQIQEDDLQNLQLFTEYAQLAQKNSRMTPFQKLIFLVRDWQNSEEHDYGYEGGADYVEEVLKVTKTQKKELQTLRKKLGKSFQDIQGFLMPHPGLRIAKNNSETVLGQIEEEEQINIFVPSLFEAAEIEPKMIAGNPITCTELFHLFKNYMEVFNDDELPAPKSILDATASAANQAAEESSKAEYDHIVDEFMTSNPNLTNVGMLRNVHDKAKMKALDIFDSKPKLGGAQLAVKHRDNLLSVIEMKFNELQQRVEHRRRNEEQKKQLEEQRKRQEEQRRKDEQKAAEERERLKIEAEEQERKRRELEEKERRRQEEARRWEEEQRRKEQEAREERERLRRQAEEQERRRRQIEEEDRQRREEQKRREEEWRQKELQRQREAEDAHQRALREMKEREAQRQLETMRRMEREMMNYQQLFGSPASSGYGSSFSSPSYSNPRPSGVRDENVNRWRDAGAPFAYRNPCGEVRTPSSAPRRTEPYFDEKCNRWRGPDGRFCKNPNQ